MLRNKSGLSLTTMVITIMIMFVIMGTLVYSAVDSVKIRKVNNLYNDLRALSDAVEIYYLKNGRLPVIKDDLKTITITKGESRSGNISKNHIEFVLKDNVNTVVDSESFVNPNDYVSVGTTGDATYQFLDLHLLENLSLNFPNDEYIVNTNSHTIYNLTGINASGEVYHYLPIKYSKTKYNEKLAASSIRLRPLDGVVDGTRIYFPVNNTEMNLKDLLVFDSEEGDGLGEPKDLVFDINDNNNNYTLDNSTGILKRNTSEKNNTLILDDVSQYNTVVTVGVINYGEVSPSISKSFTISSSSIEIYSTEKKEAVDHINLVKKHDDSIYVYQKNKTSEEEYKILKNGFINTQNDIDIVPTLEDNEIASATCDKNIGFDKNIIIESGVKAGSTDLTAEVQEYGFAKDTIKVNVFDFNIFEESNNGAKALNQLNFGGVGEINKTNLNLNCEGVDEFKFNGSDNKVEWTIDNEEIADLSLTQDTTKVTIIPKKIGQANLRCSVFIEEEKLLEILVPINVSGIEKVNGEEIENNTISFTKDGVKSVDLKYTFGNNLVKSYTIESLTIVPSDDFTIVKNNDNTFTVTHVGSADVTGTLTIIVSAGEEKYRDTINIVVS